MFLHVARWTEACIGHVLARRGYHVIIQDSRGRGDSEGHFDPLDEQQDGADAIEWITRQNWYNADRGVFLFGISFAGYSAFAALSACIRHRPTLRQHLRGVAALYSSTRLMSLAYRDDRWNWDLLVRYFGLLLFSGNHGGTWSMARTLLGVIRILSLGVLSSFEGKRTKAALLAPDMSDIAERFTDGCTVPLLAEFCRNTQVSPTSMPL